MCILYVLSYSSYIMTTGENKMIKYEQTSKRGGRYSIGNTVIRMSPQVYAHKPARLAYVMGYLASRKDKLDLYESRRAKYDLPLQPFNAAYRISELLKENQPNQEDLDKIRSGNRTSNCSDNSDIFGKMERMRRNPGFIPSWAWERNDE